MSTRIRTSSPKGSNMKEFRCFVAGGRLTAISQYISTIYSPVLVDLAPAIRQGLITYFANELQQSLSKLYQRYAVDIVLVNPRDSREEWKFMVIEANPFFELTGEGLFESEEGRKIMNGEDMDVEYPVMRVQTLKMVDGTEKELLTARRAVESELSIIVT